MKRDVSVIITDLDNTLYDWVDIWYRSFKPMLDTLIEMSGIAPDILIAEFKTIHERHGTSEYAFSIEELPSLQVRHPECDLTEIYADAIKAYREGRADATRLYPSVEKTLGLFKAQGSLIAAYTESMEYYSCSRLRRLGLDKIVDILYSPPDHKLPDGCSPAEIRTRPPEHYQLAQTVQKFTPEDETKPSTGVLNSILRDLNVDKSMAVYIGDDLNKDVSMAQSTGVLDAWAKYGVAHDRDEYELLKRVTHWPAEAVRRQKTTTEREIEPTIILEHQFEEVLQFVTPIKFEIEAVLDR